MKKACVLAIVQFILPAAIYAFLLWSKLPWPGNLVAVVLLGYLYDYLHRPNLESNS